MLRMVKYLRIRDWLMLAALLGFLVLQIWCDVTLPTYTAEIVTKMQAGASAGAILATGKVMLAYAGISIAATLAETVLSAIISTGLGKRMRQAVFGKVLTLSEKESGKFTAGSLLTRTTNDVQQVVSALVLGMRLGIGAPLMAVLAVVRIAQSAFELTVATAVGVAVLLGGIMTILAVVTPRFKRIQRLTDRLNGVTREGLTGLRVVRAYNAEAYQEKKFGEVNAALTKANLFTTRVQSALNPLIMAVNYGITIAIYWIGCWLIVKNDDPAFFPTMFSFTQLAGQVVLAFMVLVMLFTMLPRAQVSAGRINEILRAVPSVRDGGSPAAFAEEGAVTFENVSYGYDGAEQPVVSGVSFSVSKGQTLAIVGSTGAGKSTLLKLILRFFDATEGRVLVNGVNVRDLPQRRLRGLLGYVPQKSLLFSGTVRENIAFGRPEATEEEIRRAAEVACAAEFIAETEHGYDAPVSQGGKNFSGGQRQRLAIARAVAVRPQIYLFDDCFSALDYATDAKVRGNLKTLAPEATKIVVAQRIGTIRDADRIVVLERGRAVGVGTHEELLRTCEAYRAIARSQLTEEELAL